MRITKILVFVSFSFLLMFSQALAEDKSAFKLKLPLPAGNAWRVNTEVGGKCGKGCKNRRHTDVANAFYAIDFNRNVEDKKSSNPNGRIVEESKDGGVIDVLAAADGVVKVAINTPCSNRHAVCKVVIDHGNGFTTEYLHLAENSLRVQVGSKVSVGDVIAKMGNTGPADFVHLHFQINYQDRSRADQPELKTVTLEGSPFADFKSGYFYMSTNGFWGSPL